MKPELQMIAAAKLSESRTNPRKSFDEDGIKDLADSIAAHGLLSPLTVRMVVGDFYEIIAGARRYRACCKAGVKAIPCIVLDTDEVNSLEVQIVENLQRENLHPLEEAEAIQKLMAASGQNAEYMGMRIGKTPQYIWNKLKLLSLSDDLKGRYLLGQLNHGQALALARLPLTEQKYGLKQIEERDLGGPAANVEFRDIRLAHGSTRSKPRPARNGRPPEVRRMAEICLRKTFEPWEIEAIGKAVAILDAGKADLSEVA